MVKTSSPAPPNEETPLLDVGASPAAGCASPTSVATISRWVYVSHSFTCWNQRMWSFAIGIFLVEVLQQSLLLTALYGFSSGCSVLLFGAPVGQWLDRTERLKAARWTLIVNKSAIGLCALILILLLQFDYILSSTSWQWLRTLGYILVILLADVADLASTGNTIAIEQDWVVEMSGGDTQQLSLLTSTLRRIDLSLNIIAPIICGQVMTFGSMSMGALLIATSAVISLFLEYRLLWKVYQTVPALATRVKKAVSPVEHTEEAGRCPKLWAWYCSWRLYAQQPVLFAGLALASLYLTVLGFDNVTRGYAYSQGLSEAWLGIIMALGAASGILATFIFPWMTRRFGLVNTGRFGLTYQLVCLAAAVFSIWAPGSPLHYGTAATQGHRAAAAEHSWWSVSLLMSGIVLSRSGLWLADLSITQQFMESVAEADRGKVNGVQNSLNRTLDMFKYICVIALPRPHTFWILILISYGFTTLASLLYTIHTQRKQFHLPN